MLDDELDELDDARHTMEVYQDVYRMLSTYIQSNPDACPWFRTLREIQRERRVNRVIWHRMKKLARITHQRGNSVPRALFWMWVCDGVTFVSDMTPEWRQRLDYLKATA